MATIKAYHGYTGIARVLAEIDRRLGALLAKQEMLSFPRNPAEMLAEEEAGRRLGGEVADLLTASKVFQAHLDEGFVGEAVAEARNKLRRETDAKHVKNVGWRKTSFKLPHGLEVSLKTPYLRPTRRGLRGRPRGSGKRRGGGVGAYPVLERLGISDMVTPLTRSDIGRQLCLSSSYAEAQEQLRRHGLELDIDTLVDVAVGTGRRGLALRDDALRRARESELPEESPFAGKRLRVSLDGGRARIRYTKRRSPKGKNGRRPFTLAWKEPRIITIDVLDDEGELDRTWRPIYETTMGKADEVFTLLTGLLRLIGAHLAAEVIFVADGANWIWERLERLVKDAEIPPERVYMVLDFYHAAEHIAEALKSCKNIKNKERAALLQELCRMLLEPGGPQRVIMRLARLARGRRAAKVNKEISYLKDPLCHMEYAELRSKKVPIGSGVVESAVRRILNLRFKSASMCWRDDRLEPLLYLRAIIKSGRWDDAMTAWLKGRHWIPPAQSSFSNARFERTEAA